MTMIVLSQAENMMTRVATESSTSKSMALGELLGLIKGDGSINEYRIAFYNSEMFCVKKYLENFYKIFGIQKEKFLYYVELRNKRGSKKKISKWKRYLQVRRKIKLQTHEKTRKEYGMIRIMINRKSISNEIRKRIEMIEQGKENNKEVLIGFLKGFFAAEGCVIPGKVHKEVPNSIQFPQKWKKLPERINKILKKFGIDSRVVIKQRKADYYCVNITAFENFKRFYDMGLADLHPEKKKKIEIGLRSYKLKMVRRLTRINELLEIVSKKPIDRYGIYKKMNISRQHVNGLIYAKKSLLVRNNYIEKFIDNERIKWRITPEGINYLKEN